MSAKGIFCQTKAATNEEYRRELIGRNWKLALLCAVGIAVSATAALAWRGEVSGLPDYMMGVYCGAGAGIALAGGLIGGIFYPILVKAVLFIVYVFLFSYLVARKVYEKRM